MPIHSWVLKNYNSFYSCTKPKIDTTLPELYGVPLGHLVILIKNKNAGFHIKTSNVSEIYWFKKNREARVCKSVRARE